MHERTYVFTVIHGKYNNQFVQLLKIMLRELKIETKIETLKTKNNNKSLNLTDRPFINIKCHVTTLYHTPALQGHRFISETTWDSRPLPADHPLPSFELYIYLRKVYFSTITCHLLHNFSGAVRILKHVSYSLVISVGINENGSGKWR